MKPAGIIVIGARYCGPVADRAPGRDRLPVVRDGRRGTWQSGRPGGRYLGPVRPPHPDRGQPRSAGRPGSERVVTGYRAGREKRLAPVSTPVGDELITIDL